MTDHPFIKLDKWGSAAFAMRDFATALAAELGAKTGEMEGGTYVVGHIALGDLALHLNAEYGAKMGRVKVSIGYAGPYTYDRRISWPSITVDASRPLDKIAADVKRRVIEPAAAPLAQLREIEAALANGRAAVEAQAAKITKCYPFASVKVKTGEAQADLYMNRDVYLSGRLNANGSLYVDRLGTVPPERLSAVLAALFGPL